MGRTFLLGFAPMISNYRRFALLRSGIVIGFPVGQVAFPPCNRVSAFVPYTPVRKYLNIVGEQLVAAVRESK